jgi:lysozyme
MNRIAAWIRDQFEALKPQLDDLLLPLIRHFEGYYANWYKCSSNVPTIGYGHTGSMLGLETEPWAEAYAAWVLSEHDLKGKYIPATMEACAKAGIDFTKLSVAQQAVFISMCYNAGPGSITGGTWVKRFKSRKPRAEVEQAFYRWNKSGGKVSPGLVRRRFSEMVLFWEGRVDFEPEGWREYYELHS